VVCHQFPGKQAAVSIRCDKRGKNENPGVRHEFCHLGNPADVFFSVFWAQTQVTVQTATDIVTVQDVAADPHIEQTFFEGMGQGGFAASG